MAHIAPDHRVSTHEAFRALDDSSERLKQAMIDSAESPQDAAATQ